MSRTIKTKKSLCPVLGSIKKSPCPVPRNTGPVLPINNEQSLNNSIRTTVRNLHVNLCENILFINALIGCDTTFSLYGLGKGSSLKAFRESAYFGEQAYVFSKAYDCSKFTPESIVSAGEKNISLPVQRKID